MSTAEKGERRAMQTSFSGSIPPSGPAYRLQRTGLHVLFLYRGGRECQIDQLLDAASSPRPVSQAGLVERAGGGSRKLALHWQANP